MNSTLQSPSVWNNASALPGEVDERLAADGSVRPHWKLVSDHISSLGHDALAECSSAVDQFIRENGVTFHASDNANDVGRDRPWQLSVVPFVVSADQWQQLSDGLAARTRLLQTILVDLLGEQRLIREGIVPGELLWSNPSFYRAYHQLDDSQQKLHITAADLARDADGVWRVVGDRTRAPSGLGYLLENRVVTSRVMPKLIRRSNTLRLASFFESLRDHLNSLAYTARDNPRVAMLSPPTGSYREFEDNYLARYLGLTVAQGSDLAVRSGELNLKTLGGLLPIQVLWRHISDRRCDSLELDPDSSEGVTGLLRCVRRNSVAVVNTIGSVLVQTPGLIPYLDAAHQFFYNSPLELQSPKTYWCGDPEHFRYVMANLETLKFRSAFRVSGEAAISLRDSQPDARASFLQKLQANPGGFVAQEPLKFSKTPVWTGERIESKKVALRSFQLMTPMGVKVLPGGLARVGENEVDLSRSPVSGQMTLDCWVTSGSPVDHDKTLLPDSKTVVKLRRGGDELPSRIAEHLYWLGRYAERGESIARVMHSTLIRIAGEENWEMLPEVRRLIHRLASMGQIEPGFAVDSFAANLPQVEQTLPASILDREQPRGLIRTMDSVLQNATAVRNRLSREVYRIVQRAAHDLSQPSIPNFGSSVPVDGEQAGLLSVGESIERVERLVVDLLALAGLASENLVRTHAWQFLELGRRLERAEQICELLVTMVCPATEQGKAICEAVLETTDSLVTYRSRYINLMQLAPVIDILVTDETNPRSLRYQLDAIDSLMNALPRLDGPVGLDANGRIVVDLLYQVTIADPRDLCEMADDGSLKRLQKLLENFLKELPRLAEGITARYLIHTETRQILTGTGR